jgi:hypothetical protein
MNEPATEVQHKARHPKGRQYYYYRPQHSATRFLHVTLHLRSMTVASFAANKSTAATGPLKDAALCAVRVSHPAAAATCQRRSHDVKS